MSATPNRVLIVDDEPNIRSGMALGLKSSGLEIATASDVDEAWNLFEKLHPRILITDLRMPGARTGIDLVRKVMHGRPETKILVVTAFGSIESAVEAMRLGAYDYITKPVDLELLRMQVRKALDHSTLSEENRLLREDLAARREHPEILGESEAIKTLFSRIRRIADTELTVLIQGESGTGKELVAKAIHDLSPRNEAPFIAVNVGALPETLIESELFGHEKGAFSGADRRKPGWFEMARGGTLFLDEIGEMTPKTQVDLLRVLEQRELRRLGGETLISIDARFVVATHRDVDKLVAEGKLREDLYYRLNVVSLRVPPLRERREDIPMLAEFFLARACARHRREPKRIAGAAMKILCDYSWPGNVRQLINSMERLAVMVDDETIHAEDLPAKKTQTPRISLATTLDDAVQEAEKAAILAALETCNRRREPTAKVLGISVRTLQLKMSRLGIS